MFLVPWADIFPLLFHCYLEMEDFQLIKSSVFFLDKILLNKRLRLLVKY